MRLAALFSGGKDSTYAAYLMEQQGHTVEVLVSVLPSDPYSMVFHTPNLHLLPVMAEAMERRLVTMPSDGCEKGDLAALHHALSQTRVEGVVTGAIASDYQWDRINGVCQGMGLRTFSPLWRKKPATMMRDLIQSGVRAMVVAVMAEGLTEEWLGRIIDQRALEELIELEAKKGISPSGEGGEYESLVLDSPLHTQALEVGNMERSVTRDQGRLQVKDVMLRGKA